MVRLAFCTKDIDFQMSIFEKYEGQTIELTNFRSTQALLQHVKSSAFDVIVLDEDIYKLENSNNVKSITIKELLQYLDLYKKETVFAFISNSAKGFKHLERTFDKIFYFNKGEFESHRFLMFISCCESFLNYPVMVSELPLKEKITANLYFSGHSDLSEKVFMKKGMLITSSFISTLKKKNINHLYVHKSDMDLFCEHHSLEISRNLFVVCASAQKVLLKLLDDSGKFSSKHSNQIVKNASEVCEKVFTLIQGMNNSKTSFNLIILPRSNSVNFAVNNIILASIMYQMLNKRFDLDLGVAAFSSFHFINREKGNSNKLKFALLSEKILIDFQRHFREKGVLRSSKALAFYNLAFENTLGTGIPNGELLNIEEPEYEIIKLCILIQELRLVHNGELEKPFENLFPEVKKIEKSIGPKLFKIIHNLCH